MVLVIIGSVVGSASVFLSGDNPAAVVKKEIERFLTYSDHASDSAIISGESVGLIIEPPQWRGDSDNASWAYRWQKNTAQGWVDAPEIKPVELPNNIELLVLLNGQEWNVDDPPEIPIPIVAFFPSGEVSPFEIQFVESEGAIGVQHVNVNPWGEVVWQEYEETVEEGERKF